MKAIRLVRRFTRTKLKIGNFFDKQHDHSIILFYFNQSEKRIFSYCLQFLLCAIIKKMCSLCSSCKQEEHKVHKYTKICVKRREKKCFDNKKLISSYQITNGNTQSPFLVVCCFSLSSRLGVIRKSLKNIFMIKQTCFFHQTVEFSSFFSQLVNIPDPKASSTFLLSLL